MGVVERWVRHPQQVWARKALFQIHLWTGIGVVGTTIAGIWLFQESSSPLRLLFILLIFISIIGLRLTGGR